jgi:hypothetical protein
VAQSKTTFNAELGFCESWNGSAQGFELAHLKISPDPRKNSTPKQKHVDKKIVILSIFYRHDNGYQPGPLTLGYNNIGKRDF